MPADELKTPDYLSFLRNAAEEINSSSNYDLTLKNIAKAMVPNLSDWCAVDILDKTGSLRRVAIAHVDPKQVKIAMELGRKYPRATDAPSGTPRVVSAGEPEMFNCITDDMLVQSAIDEEHLELMRSLRFYSIMIFPIKSRRKVLGTLTFVWSEHQRKYSLVDLAFAETLCAIAGSAIDNARLLKAFDESPLLHAADSPDSYEVVNK